MRVKVITASLRAEATIKAKASVRANTIIKVEATNRAKDQQLE